MGQRGLDCLTRARFQGMPIKYREERARARHTHPSHFEHFVYCDTRNNSQPRTPFWSKHSTTPFTPTLTTVFLSPTTTAFHIYLAFVSQNKKKGGKPVANGISPIESMVSNCSERGKGIFNSVVEGHRKREREQHTRRRDQQRYVSGA